MPQKPFDIAMQCQGGTDKILRPMIATATALLSLRPVLRLDPAVVFSVR